MRAAEDTQATKLPGVIDTLTEGFLAINRRPWVLAVPVALDLLLWRGPHITALPLFQRFWSWYQESFVAAGQVWAPSGQRVEEMQQMAEAAVAGFNMLTLLVANIASVPATTTLRPGDTPLVYEVTSEASFAVLVVLLLLLGVTLGAVYFGLIAQIVRDGSTSMSRLFSRLASFVMNFIALMLLILAAGLLLTVPLTALVLVGAAFGGVVAQAAVGVVASIIYFVVVWSFMLLYFCVDAVVVSEVGATRAILNSVLVVGKNFWSSLGLITLVFVIASGMQVIWSNLSYSTLGVLAGILGNAYIASGLAAASMLFYQSRLVKLEEDGIGKRFLLRRR